MFTGAVLEMRSDTLKSAVQNASAVLGNMSFGRGPWTDGDDRSCRKTAL